MSTQPSIRILRRSLDLSLNQLAHMAGIAPSSLSKLELGIGAAHHEAHVRSVLARVRSEMVKATREMPIAARPAPEPVARWLD